MRFYGNEICCGSYAVLNAVRDSSIDLQLFEISLSTPFGIRHCENQKFDRLLTTYCDPNKGMDRALLLWGYHVKTDRFDEAKEAVIRIKKLLSLGKPVVVGPINMGSLEYQIFPSLLNRMDHYLLIEACSDTEIYCTDSEGFSQYRLTYEDVGRYMKADEVPEAEGMITVRQLYKEKQYDVETILKQSLIYAANNYYEAENSGEGSHAIRNCARFIKQYSDYRWRLPLMYDVQYLKQRKILALYFADLIEKYKVQRRSSMMDFRNAILSQNELLGEIYGKLRKGELLESDLFDELAEREKILWKCLQ